MTYRNHVIIVGSLVLAATAIYLYAPTKEFSENAIASDNLFVAAKVTLPELGPQAMHIKTPKQVKAIYMTSWVAGTPSTRERVLKLIDETEVNAIVIDIKDATGKVSFPIESEPFVTLGSTEDRIPDIVGLTNRLHNMGVYVIGRVAVFQDPYLIKQWPEEAVKTESDKNVLWRDRKGIGWFDAGSEKVWEYITQIAEESYRVGFDEINFDYVRFPSDGNMKDIYFPISEGKSKPDALEGFFTYVDEHLRQVKHPITISADLFGMVTTNTDDLGIGQVLERAAPHFDFIGPMVYPSHFPNGWNGYKNPAEKPYEVIKKTMDSAVAKLTAIGEDPKKLRPWLQDFNLGAVYTADMVRAQIQATYDAGLDSWMMWDPKNVYTRDAFDTM